MVVLVIAGVVNYALIRGDILKLDIGDPDEEGYETVNW